MSPRLIEDLRAVGSFSLERVAIVMVFATAAITVAGNGSPIWWSGLAPTLLVGPLAWVWLCLAHEGHLYVSRECSSIVVVLAAFAIVSMFSLLICEPSSEQVVFWLSAYVAPVFGFLAFQALRIDKKRAQILLVVIGVGATVPLVSGVVAFYKAWGIPTGLDLLMARYDLGRMAGYMAATFGNTSNTAAYLALLLPTMLSAAVDGAFGRLIRTGLWMLVALLSVHLLIVQSRTLLFVVLLAVIAIVFFHKLPVRRVMLIFAVSVGVVVLPAISAIDRLLELTLGAVGGVGSDQSVTERVEAMNFGWRLLADNPAFGVGPGGALQLNPYTSAHQSWIQQGSELGVPGLILAVLLTVAVVYEVGRTWTLREHAAAKLQFTFLVGPTSFMVYGVIANATLAQSVITAWAGLFGILCAAAAGVRLGCPARNQ